MNHLSEVLRIIRAGMEGDKDKLGRYAMLLAHKLEDEEEGKQAQRVRNAVAGDGGRRLHLMHEAEKKDG